jgi:ABC-2 type transport system ATP-binding protein
MLEIQGLSKKYKGAERPALDAVSFSVAEGGFIALLGPNGAGKSTLIGILAGTVKPDSGSVTVNGFPLQSRDPGLKLSLGIVPQEIVFDPYFTVEETLSFQSGYFGIRKNQERIRMLLRRLSLWDKRREPVKNLSGGMKRRLLIAKALVHRPRLLLLDEPTAGVDVHLRMQMHELLTELNREGLTIILTTHYLEEAEKLCGRIVLLNRGAVIADASRADFLKLAGDRFIADIETGTPENLRAALLPLGLEYGEDTGTTIRLAVSRSLRSRFLSALGEHAGEVTDIRISQPSLEDAFRKLTDAAAGEDPRDATA